MDYVRRLRKREIFSRDAPIEIDVGCGDGDFIVEQARRYPEHNFLGIERLLGRVRKTCRKAARAGLSNVKVLRIESSYAIRYLLPHASVARIYLLFPDPWPRARHRRRRVLSSQLIADIASILEPEGLFCVKTDHNDYFHHMLEEISRQSILKRVKTTTLNDLPVTRFERSFREQGKPIHTLCLQRINEE